MKAIVVGLGGRGRGWLKDCMANPDVEVVAAVEPFAENKNRASSEFNFPKEKIHDDLSTAIKKAKADFVVDVTPPAEHEKVALTAFENGLNVLGEKPLSDDFDAAKRVVAAGKKAGVKHMITQNYRWNGQPRTTRKLVAEGQYGPVGQLDISFYMSWADIPGSHYVNQPYMFLTDMGIHHFDMMRYVIGQEPETVQAVTWNLPWGWHKGDAAQIVVFKFPGNLYASHRAVGCTLGKRTGWNGEWRIETQKGTITWEADKIFHTQEHRADPQVRTEIPQVTEGLGGPPQLLKDFVQALKDNKQPECNAEDNLKSMRMVFGALKSTKEKREVKLSEL